MEAEMTVGPAWRQLFSQYARDYRELTNWPMRGVESLDRVTSAMRRITVDEASDADITEYLASMRGTPEAHELAEALRGFRKSLAIYASSVDRLMKALEHQENA